MSLHMDFFLKASLSGGGSIKLSIFQCCKEERSILINVLFHDWYRHPLLLFFRSWSLLEICVFCAHNFLFDNDNFNVLYS